MDLTNIVEVSTLQVDESKMSRADIIRNYIKELKDIDKEIKPYLDVFNEMKKYGVYRIHEPDYGEIKILERDNNNNPKKAEYRYETGCYYGERYCGESASGIIKKEEKIGDFFEEKIGDLMKKHNRIVWKLNNLGEPIGDKYFLFVDKSRYEKVRTVWPHEHTYEINAFNVETQKFNGYLQSKVSNIFRLADKLGYVIIPFRFIIDKIYKEITSMNSYSCFRSSIDTIYKDGWCMYAMCPIDYIDLIGVVSSEDMPSIYFSPDLSPFETNLNMTLPLFRTLYSTTTLLSDDVDEIKKRLEKIDGENKNKAKKEIGRMQESLTKASAFNIKNKGGNECLGNSVMVFAIETEDGYKEDLTKLKDSDATIGFGVGSEFDDSFANLIGVKNNGITKKSKRIL